MAMRWRMPFTIPPIEELAIPGVSVLILFLAYTSQYLFYYMEPGPLSRNQALWFNVFVLGIWWCYDRAVTTDPGPNGWVERVIDIEDEVESEEDEAGDSRPKRGMRWCKKCEAIKPPRAHHCRQCGRYISYPDLCDTMLNTLVVFPKWTITVLGPRIASPIRTSPIFSASSFTP